ncbi:MAG: helix-turn-helix domain-containing protein [Polaromonas sp.]|uniref:helix-turn-helix domain-containing protein n=1 Tax=Polaromonas sp. TaxID=1869339 RepID=UPI002489BC39|nr:helix-turn-helix domain-containing protein [Polaromonas sp.]MDI1236409.1 helix-turn-helix domain-containing protein [Polaromonas sp.]
MPNLASLLKGEISRISKKEARAESLPQKKASAQYRSEIAALKRRVLQLEKTVRALAKTNAKPQPAAQDVSMEGAIRFSPSGFASLRRRLGLSAAETGALIGVSDQSIYKWEDGKSRPREMHMPAIAAFRKMTKRAAAAALEAL